MLGGAAIFQLLRLFGQRARPVAVAIVTGTELPRTPYRLATIAGALLLLPVSSAGCMVGAAVAGFSGFLVEDMPPPWPGWGLEAATWIQGGLGLVLAGIGMCWTIACTFVVLYGLVLAALVLTQAFIRADVSPERGA